MHCCLQYYGARFLELRVPGSVSINGPSIWSHYVDLDEYFAQSNRKWISSSISRLQTRQILSHLEILLYLPVSVTNVIYTSLLEIILETTNKYTVSVIAECYFQILVLSCQGFEKQLDVPMKINDQFQLSMVF